MFEDLGSEGVFSTANDEMVPHLLKYKVWSVFTYVRQRRNFQTLQLTPILVFWPITKIQSDYKGNSK